MAVIHANGIAHHVQRLPPRGHTGDEPAPIVVLVHGMLIDSMASFYFTLAPAFAAAGMDVILYDLRGHGRSTRPPTGYTLTHFLDDLDGLLAALDIRTPVHLVGNSFGGTLVYGYAERRPDLVASVAAIEATPATPTWAEQMAATMDFTKNDLPRPEVIPWIHDNHGEQAARLARAAVDLVETTSLAEELPASDTLPPERFAALTTPVLAVYGDGEGSVPPPYRMDTLLPSCTTVVVPGHGHFVLINQPGLFRELILDWLLARSAPTRERVRTRR